MADLDIYSDNDDFSSGSDSPDFSAFPFFQMALHGSIMNKEGGKLPQQAMVPRYCRLNITKLELLRPISEYPSNLLFAVRMQRSKKTLRAERSIETKVLQNGSLQLDICFSFQYLHNLKPPFDKLRIMIQTKSKKRSLREHKIVGVVSLNMNELLQCPLEGDLTLYRPDKRKMFDPKEKSKKKEGKRDEKRDSKKEERKEERKEKEIDFEFEREKESQHPVAKIGVSVGVYPSEIETPQDAQEWDDQFFMEDFLFDRDELSSSEEEYETDLIEVSDEEELGTSPSNLEQVGSHSLMADMMKSRFAISSQQGTAAQKGKKLKIPKYMKLRRRNKNREDIDEIFNDEDLNEELYESSGSSSEEETFGPSEVLHSMAPKREASSPISIRRAGGSFSASVGFQDNLSPAIREMLEIVDDFVILINGQKKRGKKLENSLKEMKNLKNRVIGTKNFSEVTSVLSVLISKNQQSKSTSDLSDPSSEQLKPMKILIIGDDCYVNHILRPYVDILSKKPRGWKPPSFFLIPLGKKHEIALSISSVDSTYRSLFFSKDTFSWFDMVDKPREELSTDEFNEIEKRIVRYLQDSSSVYSFQISETQLSYPNSNNATAIQKNVPFIKGLKLRSTGEDTNDPQLDYWFPKKKGEGHKDLKSFQFAYAIRLPLSAEIYTKQDPETKPTNSTFCLVVQHKDQSKKGKMKEALQHFGGIGKGSPQQLYNVVRINRLLCSSEGDVTFKVDIDGVEWTGIKFLSISPEWHSHVKSFPIAHFAKEVKDTQPPKPTQT